MRKTNRRRAQRRELTAMTWLIGSLKHDQERVRERRRAVNDILAWQDGDRVLYGKVIARTKKGARVTWSSGWTGLCMDVRKDIRLVTDKDELQKAASLLASD